MSQRPSYKELEKRIKELEELLCAQIPTKAQKYLQKIVRSQKVRGKTDIPM